VEEEVQTMLMEILLEELVVQGVVGQGQEVLTIMLLL
jgi:hypothetical protein